jgi:hypothetical protein
LVLTEVMPDPSAVDDSLGEYFEVFARRDVDLNQVTFASETYSPPSSANSLTISGSTCRSVAAGTYSVFARSADPNLNGGIDAVFATFSFGLGNTGNLSRQVKIVSLGLTLDSLAFPLAPSAPAGTSIQLIGGKLDASDNDEWTNLTLTPTSHRFGGRRLVDGGAQLGDRGTPGSPNVAPSTGEAR